MNIPKNMTNYEYIVETLKLFEDEEFLFLVRNNNKETEALKEELLNIINEISNTNISLNNDEDFQKTYNSMVYDLSQRLGELDTEEENRIIDILNTKLLKLSNKINEIETKSFHVIDSSKDDISSIL